MQMSKQITIQGEISYDTLKEVIDADRLIPKIQKYYANSLAVRRINESQYQFIYPDHLHN